ncbi:MAG: aldehyde dehydrogenase [Bryobacteraceae bacterium]|nr:MAG: aldehyde dehydrogenase [Bryobacteraceae bacterium]
MRNEYEQLVAELAREVLERLEGRAAPSRPAAAAPAAERPAGEGQTRVETGDGVFETVDEAVAAAAEAQKRVAAMSLAERGRLVEIIKDLCQRHAAEWGRLELEETGLGRLDHKIEKLKIIRNVPGVEMLQPQARTDASGLCLIERAPWGVVGMVLPATHSAPTLASNAINVLAAGNTAVFSPHPAGARIAMRAVQHFNRAFERETGLRNALTTCATASIRTAEEVFRHPNVALLCVTGGPGVVRAAMKHGKRVIAAGPGNPPVVVDETADLDLAARSVVQGASFDNNLLCIGEKEVFVVDRVFDAFLAAMRRARAWELKPDAIERLTRAAFDLEHDGKGCAHGHLKKDLIGKDVSVLAAAAGVEAPPPTELLIGVTGEDHVFVQEEQMMPFVPIVRVRDFDDAVRAAVKAERGFRHTAILHTRDMGRATVMARAVNTTLFVVNGPCVAALGAGGAGYLSYSIATPTGEGVTTPLTFTRERQVTLAAGALRII